MTWFAKLGMVCLLLTVNLGAEARVALKEDATLENGLVTVAIARKFYKTCSDIEPRKLKAYGFLRALHRHAKGLGYSNAEIEAYLDSDTDKKRVEGKADQYMLSKGADLNETGTLCALGRAEIAEESFVGKYLRVD